MGERRGRGEEMVAYNRHTTFFYKTGRATDHTIRWNLWVVSVGCLESGTRFETGAGSALARK